MIVDVGFEAYDVTKRYAAPAKTEQSARKLTAVADRSRGEVVRIFRRAFRAGRAAIDLTTTELLSGSGFQDSLDVYLERALAAAEADLLPDALPALFLKIAARAGNAVRTVTPATKARAAKGKEPVKVLQAFDRTNLEAVTWAGEHSATLVSEVLDETRKAIRKVIVAGFQNGIAPRELSRILVSVVSLTEVQANAVVNLHQTILTSPGRLVRAGKVRVRVPVEGMDDARLDKVLHAYADRLSRQRAIAIARTETIAASNKGQELLWQQAQEKGLLPAVLRHAWIAAPSERTCPICLAMDGETVVVGEMFSGGVTLPPAHVMCRCTTGLA